MFVPQAFLCSPVPALPAPQGDLGSGAVIASSISGRAARFRAFPGFMSLFQVH